MAGSKKVLVTGAAGFVGSHTIDLLLERGDYDVVALDSLDPQVHGEGQTTPKHLAGHLAKKAIRFIHGDVRDRAVMAPLIAQADAILHLAAAVGVGQSMYQPHHYSDVNVGGTAMLMDILANQPHHVTKIVVASSMSIYGEGAYQCGACGTVYPIERSDAQLAARNWDHPCPGCSGVVAPRPTPEAKPLACTSVYAITKKVQEEMLVCFGKAYRIPVVALRYFNIYGPRQSLNNPYTGVAAIFLSRLMNRAAPLVFEDGKQSRDFIHVRDIARANVAALESPQAGQHVYNVGTGQPTTVLDVARLLNQGMGLDLGAQVASQFRAGDIRHCYSDASKIERELDFRVETSREAGFRDLIEWSRAQTATDLVEKATRELRERRLVR
jgi:dTDP-L-rhamnose 4-epimerase